MLKSPAFLEKWCLPAVVLVLALAACSPSSPTPTVGPLPTKSTPDSPSPSPRAATATATLASALPATGTPVPFLPVLAGDSAPGEVLPTATPFLYKIAEGDTLLGVAFLYGLTLDEILTANPGIDPQFLSVGTDVVIPLEPGDTGGFDPEPAPVTLSSTDSRCLLLREGGWQCFVLARNENDLPLENLAALVTMFDAAGEAITSTVATADLNLLPSGAQIPLVAYFPEILGDPVEAGAAVLSALVVPEGDARYWAALTEILSQEAGPLGLSVAVTGQVTVQARAAETDTSPMLIWVVLVAYDNEGRVVGTRKIELDLGEGNRVGVPIPFSESVFSLGPGIDRVEALTEVR